MSIERLNTGTDVELHIADMLGTDVVPKYSVETIDSDSIEDDEIGLWIDTAGGINDGQWPEIDDGDYLVEVGSIETGEQLVLVFRRYTSALDVIDAADLALAAVAETEGLETDDNGDIVEIEAFFDGRVSERGMPAWVQSVAIVNPSAEDREAVKQLNRHLRGLCIIHDGDCRTNDEMARMCVHHRRNPTGLSSVAMVGIGLAAAAAAGIYTIRTAKRKS